jgi:hypothetical protein
MAIYRRGSSGAGVKELQEELNKAGAKLTVDGSFGPATEAALRTYQKENDLKNDGIAGSATLSNLGITTKSGKADYTDPEATRFNGLPGQPDIWQNSSTGQWFAVYYVPGSKPPLPMAYSIPTDDDLDTFFGDKDPVADKRMGAGDFRRTGATVWGSTDMIPAAEGDPWAGFMDRMNRAKEVQPWLEDPEVFGVQAAAWLEGRPVEKWEFEQTEYFQSRNEKELEWAWLTTRSPEEAKKTLEANYIATYDRFRNIGVIEPPEAVVDYMAERFTEGAWSEQYLDEQMTALFSGDAAVALDTGLGSLMKAGDITIEDPVLHTNAVRDLYQEWLGPVYPPTEKQIQRGSQLLRDDEEAGMDTLVNGLRQQRKALYPQYDDESLTYEDIAAPWRGFYTQQWGQEVVDERNSSFQKLIELNSTVEGAKFMRKEGMKRGVEKVEQEALAGLGSNVGQIQREI